MGSPWTIAGLGTKGRNSDGLDPGLRTRSLAGRARSDALFGISLVFLLGIPFLLARPPQVQAQSPARAVALPAHAPAPADPTGPLGTLRLINAAVPVDPLIAD